MRPRFNKNIKLFLLTTLLYGFSFSVWELFFNLYILSLGFSSDMLGLIRSATPLAALFLGLPLGILSDRIGRRKSMLIGLAVCFVGMFLEIRLFNPLFIFIFGFIQGAGMMLYRVSQPPFIMASSKEEQQAVIFSLNFGLLILASMIGNLLAGQIPGLLDNSLGIIQGSAASYRWVISAGILFATSSLIPTLLISEDQALKNRDAQRLSIKTTLRKLIGRPIVRQLALINLITGFGAAILIPYLNVFLRGKFDIGDDLLGIIFSLSSLLVFLGSIVSPLLVRWTRSRIIPTVVTQSISILFLFSLGFSPLLWIASLSMLLRTVLMQMSAPLIENYAMLISPPEEQGAITSVRGIGWQSGQAVGVLISGFVQTRFGFSPLFITTGILYAFAIFLTWTFFRPEEKQMPYTSKA
jgi:MFS family permease